ncbi:MAG: hypothetical protein JW741_09780 [Sedimentisphaerales bacterium]|nr:hypothetical protein [Sedimentisphaerales bacterium]
MRKSDVIVLVLSSFVSLLVFGAACHSFRPQSHAVGCQANLGQWDEVFQEYLCREDGRFFPDLPGRCWSWIARLDDEHKDYRGASIWFCPQASQPLIDEKGNRTGGTSVFSAWGIHKGGECGPSGMAGSYGLNGYTLDTGRTDVFEGGVPAKDGWREFDSVSCADNVPVFIDALRFDLWPRDTEPPAANEFADWSGNNMARCCINRHQEAVNCLLMDWSVRRVDLKELWTLKWHRSFDTAGPWTKAGGALPKDWPEWMRGFKDY